MVALNPHSRVRGWLRALVRSVVPGVLVLMYHRIAEAECDPQRLCVSPKQFDEHLAALRARDIGVIPLASLAQAVRDKNVPRRSVVITFDDGYADNWRAAAPLLSQYDMPATIFVTAGQIGSSREFWWDALARICLETPRLPSELNLGISADFHRSKLGAAAELDERAVLDLRGWHADEPVTHERQRLYLRLWELLYAASPREREQAMAALLGWAGVQPDARDADRAMTAEEVRRVSRKGTIEIGAHGWSHTPLTQCPPDLLIEEFARSRSELETITGLPVTSWSYPHGKHSPQTTSAASDAGFMAGCTSIPKLARRGAHPLELPRIVAGNWSGERFGAFVQEYLRV